MTDTRSTRNYTPSCDSCRSPAVYVDPGSKRHVCEHHLCQGIEERVSDYITRNRLVQDGDVVAVGLSGGKDSSVLLSLLTRIVPGTWDAGIVAVTVDEGIAGYRDQTIESAVAVARALDVPHRIVSFRSLFGITLDTLLSEYPLRACTACGILRKKALSDTAREMGATALATGHNLDDAAQSVLMNYLRGDFERLVRDSSTRNGRGFIRRIKPLRDINEKEVTLYSMINGITGSLPECPYATTAFRAEVRSLQAAVEYHYPGASRRIISGQEELARIASGRQTGAGMNTCRVCNDPCSGRVCQACRLLERIKSHTNR